MTINFPQLVASSFDFLATDFHKDFKAAVAEKLAALNTPVLMEQINIHSVTPAATASPATRHLLQGDEGMIVLASVFSVIYKSDPQGRDYFKPFIASLEGGNATAFPTLADDYGPNTGTAVETQGARPPEPLPALRSMAREATRGIVTLLHSRGRLVPYMELLLLQNRRRGLITAIYVKRPDKRPDDKYADI
eukprot:1188454-Prorocentrum_minimum.AAC.6